MKRAATRYTDVVILIGALLFPFCVYAYVQPLLSLSSALLTSELLQMGCLLIICAVCRSTPIFLNPHHAIDVSILAIITAVLLKGPCAAVVTYVMSSLVTVDYDPSSGDRHHLYNIPIRKSAFNNANLIISILFPGMLLGLMGHVPGDVRLPWVLVPMLVFTFTSFALNSLILLTMFILNGSIQLRDATKIMKSLVPNVLAAMPLGLLICFVFQQEGGSWVALIALLPLMLARYAWKLYLDAQQQQYKLVSAFTAAMEAKDKYTEGHSHRVSRYANLIACNMDLRPALIETIDMAATLHDIGKIGVPDAILLKPSRLTEAEFTAIKRHPRIGVAIVKQVALPDAVTDIILHHHERCDGSGYPDGLTGDQLSIGAKILSVADAFDAMTSERPYRKAMPLSEAMSQLVQGRGAQFDAQVVDCVVSLAGKSAFLEVMKT